MAVSRTAIAAFVAVLASSCLFSAVYAVDLRSTSCPNIIQQGQTGACVSELQRLLNIWGPDIAVDGDFGPNTNTAVRNFQASKGLSVDGLVGPNTKAALYATAPAPAPSGSLAAVLSAARSQIGVPYSWGGGHGATPGKSYGTCSGYTGSIQPCPATSTIGFDCSGLTRYAYYKAAGSDILNGATGTQESKLRNAGKATTAPRAGDVIFWDGHTAIFSGSGRMIEAQKTGTNVHEVTLRTGGRYYRVL